MPRPVIPLRPVAVRGFGGVAVSPHVLSTQAAMATMARGGNAVDAAIAANAVQGVVAPETCGIGGDLFALVAGPGPGRPQALNSSGRAGSGAARLAQDLRKAGTDSIPQRHPAAVTVPGCVDGWTELHGRWGRAELATVLEPAIRLARDGFPASRELAAAFAARRDELVEGAEEIYPGGRPPLEGERIVRPSLGGTLEAVALRGRDALFTGAIARSLSRAVDGALTPADLERPQADWVEPLSLDLFGSTAWTIPPNSQGYIALLALAITERVGPRPPDDPLAWHLAIESYRLAAADQGEMLADPDHMTVPAGDLLSARRVDRLADRYSDKERIALLARTEAGRGGTAFLCVIDDEGLGVSLIQSNFHGIGSGLSVPEGGFLLHDRGRGFSLRAGHPNELAPGKRPLHTLSPTLWTSDGRLSGLLGTRGGYMQPQLVSQLAGLIVAHRAAPERAMAAPRWMVPLPVSPEDGAVEVEPGTPERVPEELSRRGHRVTARETPQGGWGPMSTIQVSEQGLRTGAADPRVDTAAATAR